MNALILCAGEQQRLKDLPYPKQLLRVAGETLLERTVRLIRKSMPYSHIVFGISGQESIIDLARTLKVEFEWMGTEPMLLNVQNTLERRGLGQSLVLLGDVFWTESFFASFARAAEQAQGPLSACRLGPSAVTGKAYAEHFGISCSPADLHTLGARRYYCLSDAARTNVFGDDRRAHQPDGDWTEDFDTQADIAHIVPIIERLEAQKAAA